MAPGHQGRHSTGVEGLDHILNGGLIDNRAYLVRGAPGTGKTTLGLHFLRAEADVGGKPLFISMTESVENIKQNAGYINISTDDMEFLDLGTTSQYFKKRENYNVFYPSDVEKEPITSRIIETIRKYSPTCIFIDSITQFRYLARDELQFRRQSLSFIKFLLESGATVVFTSESGENDSDLQFIADGVIQLQKNHNRRFISVEKFRGSSFKDGLHSVKLTDNGMKVFPTLLPREYSRAVKKEVLSSGIPNLDRMLGGGLERGTITIITGPTGVGKTILGAYFLKEAAGQGERSLLYLFEENVDFLYQRLESVNLPLGKMIEKNILSVYSIEPMLYSGDELAHMVRKEVEGPGAHVVMIDSTAGYEIAVEDTGVRNHLHALCKYLTNMGVTVILINENEYITGDFRATEKGISYLSDNIIFLRYIEAQGEMQKAIGILKKRLSNFEKSLRRFKISKYGIEVGEPLCNLRNILSDVPEVMTENKN